MIDGQETFLFGILPIIVGLAIAIGSVTTALRTGTRFQVVIATFLVTAMAMSIVASADTQNRQLVDTSKPTIN